MFRKLLVPLDGSILAEKALPYALDLACQLNAQLLLLRIANSLDHLNRDPYTSGEGYLERVRREITEPGLPLRLATAQVETLVVYNEPLGNIPGIARDKGVDLIVMTTHGQGRVGKLVIGSCATVVVRQSDIPVLLIRATEKESRHPLYQIIDEYAPYALGSKPFKLVVPLDFEHQTESVLETAHEFARQMNAEIHLLGLVNSPASPAPEATTTTEYIWDVQEDLRLMEQYVNKVATSLSARDPEISAVRFVIAGKTVESLVYYTDLIQATMVIMPTHGRGRVGQFLRGSLATEVLRHINLPLLVINTTRTGNQNRLAADKLETEAKHKLRSGR